MTCQECELKLGMGEDAGEHLSSCAECRWLAEEMRLNAVALGEMRARPRIYWEWALAAAAAIVMAVGLWRTPSKKPAERAAAAKIVGPTIQESMSAVAAPVKHVRRVRKREPGEPLRVKMFTSDPDVVIYWIVEKKDGFE
jgi:hypothetical protein